jgi:LacI family transcriptional regulator
MVRKRVENLPGRGNATPPRVALLVPHNNPFMERVLSGIIEYARNHGGWTFARSVEVPVQSPQWLRGWEGDGAFVMVNDRREEAALRALPFPVVNLSGHLGGLSIPTVMVDQQAIGRIAAEHLLARRFRRFGYFGVEGMWYSAQRRDGFRTEIEKAGGSCSILELPIPTTAAMGWREEQEMLENWLRNQEPPLGILTSNDIRASILLDVCNRIGLLSPEEVAVVGVDNAVLTCESCTPSISSVSRSDRTVGLEAAALMDRLMSGNEAPSGAILIPPDGVVARHSTETSAIEDPQVAAAVRWIRSHIQDPFGVSQLIAIMGRSRRRVEGLFFDALGESPYRTICRLRIEHAKRLLAQSGTRPLAAVAHACGFRDVRRFRLVFTRIAGMSPNRFRSGLEKSLAVG